MPPAPPNRDARPNIVLILADDMGYSDIGCYGGEIRTPNLDALAGKGVRFSQMYNYARCCPSRAALLTGVSPHAAGIGHMVQNRGVPEYQGYLNQRCATVAELLRDAGYRTSLSGKWHVGGDYDLRRPESWSVAGDASHPTPTQRGFDHFFGTLTGAGSFFNPPTLMRAESFVQPESQDFYYTDAITNDAVTAIREAANSGQPFFQYVAFTAPHWPLHALEEDMARYEGKYRRGWDSIRTARHEELKSSGMLNPKWPIAPRDRDAPPWEDAAHPDWEDLRMAAYAAQIDRMDQGIGRIVATLREIGVEDNTLVMFLSDNGGCAEFLAEDTDRPAPSQFDTPTLDGSKMTFGNVPGLRPGPQNTFMSYDLPWANASNTPFRLFKHWTHEGGISTPFIASWPARVSLGGIAFAPAQIMDITATCLAAAGVSYPASFGGRDLAPLEGESLLPAIEGRSWSRNAPLIWEHEGNRAVRVDEWKLVSRYPERWELYNIDDDRTELNDLAARNEPKVREMADLYEAWASRSGVRPWPVGGWNPRLRGENGHVV